MHIAVATQCSVVPCCLQLQICCIKYYCNGQKSTMLCPSHQHGLHLCFSCTETVSCVMQGIYLESGLDFWLPCLNKCITSNFFFRCMCFPRPLSQVHLYFPRTSHFLRSHFYLIWRRSCTRCLSVEVIFHAQHF